MANINIKTTTDKAPLPLWAGIIIGAAAIALGIVVFFANQGKTLNATPEGSKASTGTTFAAPVPNDVWYYGWQREIKFTIPAAVSVDTPVKVVICPDNNGAPVCLNREVVQDYIIHPNGGTTHSIVWERAGYDLDGQKIEGLSRLTISLHFPIGSELEDAITENFAIVDHPDSPKSAIAYKINPNSLLGQYPNTSYPTEVAKITGENLTYGKWDFSSCPIATSDGLGDGGTIIDGDDSGSIQIPGGSGAITIPGGDSSITLPGGNTGGLGGNLIAQAVKKFLIQQTAPNYPSVSRYTTMFSNGQFRDTRVLYVAVHVPQTGSGPFVIDSDKKIIGYAVKNFYDAGHLIPQHTGNPASTEDYTLYVLPGADLPDGFYNEFYITTPCAINPTTGQPNGFARWIKSAPRSIDGQTSDDIKIGFDGVNTGDTFRMGEVWNFGFIVPNGMSQYLRPGDVNTTKIGDGAVYMDGAGHSWLVKSFDITKGDINKSIPFEYLFGQDTLPGGYPLTDLHFHVTMRERSSTEERFALDSETFKLDKEGYTVEFTKPKAGDPSDTWHVGSTEQVKFKFVPNAGITDPFRKENRMDISLMRTVIFGNGQSGDVGASLAKGFSVPANFDTATEESVDVPFNNQFKCNLYILLCYPTQDSPPHYDFAFPDHTYTVRSTIGVASRSDRRYTGGTVKLADAVIPPPVPEEPTIDAVNPNTGDHNNAQNVIITGTNFGTTQGNGKVIFDNQDATIVSWSDTAIAVTVPTFPDAHADFSIDIIVVTDSAKSVTKVAGYTYTVQPPPPPPGAKPVTATYYTKIFDARDQGKGPEGLVNFSSQFNKGNGDVIVSIGFFTDSNATVSFSQLFSKNDPEGYHVVTDTDWLPPSDDNHGFPIDLSQYDHNSVLAIKTYRVRIQMTTPDITVDSAQPWVGNMQLDYVIDVCDANQDPIGHIQFVPQAAYTKNLPSTGSVDMNIQIALNDDEPTPSAPMIFQSSVAVANADPSIPGDTNIFANNVPTLTIPAGERASNTGTITFTSVSAANGQYKVTFGGWLASDPCLALLANESGRLVVAGGPPAGSVNLNVTILGEVIGKQKTVDNSMPLYSLRIYTDSGAAGRNPVFEQRDFPTTSQNTATISVPRASVPNGTYRVFARSNRHLWKEATQTGSQTVIQKLLVGDSGDYTVYFDRLVLGDVAIEQGKLYPNNTVESTDLTYLLQSYGLTGLLDFDNDGVVSATDLTIMLGNYAKSGNLLP